MAEVLQQIADNVSLDGHQTKEGVVATVSEDWLDKDDLRLVALTYDGRAVTGRSRIEHPQRQKTQTTVTTTLPGLILKEIKNINVERRPYEWTCFSYIPASARLGQKRVDNATATRTIGRKNEEGAPGPPCLQNPRQQTRPRTSRSLQKRRLKNAK